MKIRLSETKFYFLTCNNEKRKRHILEEFKEYDVTEVNPVSINIGISKEQSGATGFTRMIDIATINQDRKKQFQQFMLIEELYKQVEKLQIQQESGMHNKVNIEFLTKQLEKALEDIEKLKDKARDQHYKNGNGG